MDSKPRKTNLNVGRDRIGEESEFGYIGSRSDVNPFGVIVQGGLCSCQVGRQSTVHAGIHQFGTLSEEEFSKVVKRKTGLFHYIGDGHGLEISTMVNVTAIWVHKRVVGGCRRLVRFVSSKR
jgi:hypothetical protein